VAHRRSSLIRSDALYKLRQIFRPYVEERAYSDFAIISRDGIQVASGLDEFLGQNSIASLNSSLLADVFKGTPGVGDPFQLPPDPHIGGRARINMLVGAPIFDASGDVMAALVFRLDPAKEFGNLTQVGRPGASGETYIFDRQAHLLTQ